jgi:beta-mannosidase
MRQELTWEVAREGEPFIPATVPGAVQLDYAKHHGWSDWWFGDNFRQYDGLEDSIWTYRTTLKATHEPMFFVCKGIDYEFEVALDGEKLIYQEGMFSAFEIDLTGKLDCDRELTVRVYPAPKAESETADRRQARESVKPAVSYEWDFHPRLIPLGIWDEAYIETRLPEQIISASASYQLTEALDSVHIKLFAECMGSPSLVWKLYDTQGNQIDIIDDEEAQSFTIKNPQLWWPNGFGEQNLYTIEVSSSVNTYTFRVGFRRSRLVMHEGAWNWPSDFPKPRSNPPMTLEINGQRIFGKGSNWVSPDVFPGTLTRERYADQLNLVKKSNMNLLRLWGGAIVQKDDFYDLCDELGIMIWQEFPLACNPYPDKQKYLEVLWNESYNIIDRLKEHPCLVLWCGGNELFNAWSGMTDQSHALRLLNANCYSFDPETPFLPTSPVSGIGHGGYTFRDPVTDEECWEKFQKSSYTAYTEFGCGGIANLEVLKSFLPEDQQFPPKPGTCWETHHAFGAWMGDTWLGVPTIERYFGPSESLPELVEKGQWLQAEGFRGLFEEARRQKPTCSMSLNWCLNEPWPTAANNSLICWPCEPKPALTAVAEACRPVLASAKIAHFAWKEGDWFDPELWILNDSPHPLAAGVFVARHGNTELLRWTFDGAEANTNVRGPRVGMVVPVLESNVFEFTVEIEGRSECSTTYRLVYQPKQTQKPPSEKKMNE